MPAEAVEQVTWQYTHLFPVESKRDADVTENCFKVLRSSPNNLDLCILESLSILQLYQGYMATLRITSAHRYCVMCVHVFVCVVLRYIRCFLYLYSMWLYNCIPYRYFSFVYNNCNILLANDEH